MCARCDYCFVQALKSVFVVTLLTSAAFACVATEGESEPCRALAAQPVIGWAETVRLMDVDIEQKARIDTGAGLASIDARIIKITKSDQPSKLDRVTFSIADGKNGTRTLEKDIVDWVNIKKKGAEGSMRRPLVIMKICLAGQVIEERINLAERKGFLYPILIGRNLLRMGRFLVDSNISFTHDPICKEE